MEKKKINLEETAFYEFVKTFFEKRSRAFENRHSVYYRNAVPFDSIDRLIALFLIEKRPDIVAIDVSNIKTTEGAGAMYDAILDAEFKEWFEVAGLWAYDNYEREWMSNAEALYYIIREAKLGVEHVLNDSYDDGGWFGAS